MTSNYAKYTVSLLKAWYGDNATVDNGFGFNYLPKTTTGVDYTHIGVFEAMATGIVKAAMIWGQNPAVGGPNAEGERTALGKLRLADGHRPLRDGDGRLLEETRGRIRGAINTEVFLLPAAGSYEKQGSISNSGRWAQWRYRAIAPIGEARPDLSVADELMLKLKDLYQSDVAAPHREAITNVTWGYRSAEHPDEADPNVVAREINGYDTSTGAPVTSFVTDLKADGSTCSAATGSSAACLMRRATTRPRRRDNVDASPNQVGLYSNWSWCWPVNRRIIYNRAVR